MSGNCSPTNKSIPTLDSIVNFLNRNKSLVIEIGTNTDYRGDSLFNLSLSEMRARNVSYYFAGKGIDTNRIKYRGYGENNPIIVDSIINVKYPFLPIGVKLTKEFIEGLSSIEKKDLANMLNRRTEIKIIRKTGHN